MHHCFLFVYRSPDHLGRYQWFQLVRGPQDGINFNRNRNFIHRCMSPDQPRPNLLCTSGYKRIPAQIVGLLRSDRTSIYMELTARGCCAARMVHKPVPMQSPGSLVSERSKPYLDRLAQSRWGSVPASSSGPTNPVLRANLFPKLRIRLADFPYLHCSIDQRLFTLETCCGYGYDLRRQSTFVCRIFNCQPNTERCSRRSALRSSRFRQTRHLQRKDNSSRGSSHRLGAP